MATPRPSQMNEAREEVLARIRAALGPELPVPAVPRDYRQAGEHPAGSSELLVLLTERLTDYRASVHPATVDTVAGVLAGLLAGAGSVVVGPGLPDDWAAATAVTVDEGLSTQDLDGFDTVLTSCAAAAAETGTIVLDGGPGQGRRAISLVPDRHICVVRADQVVQSVPELLARLDPRRPLTFISGPSATSDIELQRVEGVHGPRNLIVVLVA
jgi:L-lactate dehydrogenase complex protein LldG